MMSGMMTFRVVEKDAETLLRELKNSPANGIAVEFKAVSTEDPRLEPEVTEFKLTIEQADYTEPPTFGGRDERSGGWISIAIHTGFNEVDFTLFTP